MELLLMDSCCSHFLLNNWWLLILIPLTPELIYSYIKNELFELLLSN